MNNFKEFWKMCIRDRYVGEDVENILLKLIQAADGDIQKAQKGIIYINLGLGQVVMLMEMKIY